MKSNAGTSNAVRILHRRYVGDDEERKGSLQEERLNAEVEAWQAGAKLVRCERFGATVTSEMCSLYRQAKKEACRGCSGGLRIAPIPPVEREVEQSDPVRKITGARVREVRLARGLTQATLAKRLNISHTLVSAWETGRAEIYKDYLPKLEKWIATGKWR